MQSVKQLFKTVRKSQPFNAVATTTAKRLCEMVGRQPLPLVKHLHRVGMVRCPLPAGRELVLWSQGDELIPNRLFWRGLGGYEPETIGLFYVLARQAQVTVDVGAFVGLFALVAGHANPSADVFAFEPMVETYQRLCRNIVLNKLPRVKAVCTAVGNQQGTTDFFFSADDHGLPVSSTMSPTLLRQWGHRLQNTIVPVLSLDAFLEERQVGRVDLMKIDAETSEPEVLLGMKKALAAYRPHIICEVMPNTDTAARIEALLQPLDYRYYHLLPAGPVLQKQISGGDMECHNYLFTRLLPDEVAALAAQAPAVLAATSPFFASPLPA